MLQNSILVQLHKYHALGNDYLVLDTPLPCDHELTPAVIQRICDRHRGVGGDGILAGPSSTTESSFPLRILNPDGSDAEKSGNGLRIFARFLWDHGAVSDLPFSIRTPGGEVSAQVKEQGRSVTVEMGTVSFDSEAIPVTGPHREVLAEPLELDGEQLEYSAATIGNPHCVLVRSNLSAEEARTLGPRLETHPNFPNRSNVQFVQVLDRSSISLEIWERGAGYTLASGSSSCAAASVCKRLGLIDSPVVVHMPGGDLQLEIDDAFSVIMTGPVTRIGVMTVHPEVFA